MCKYITLLAFAVAASAASQAASAGPNVKDLDQLRDEYMQLRFGMFVHFGMATYHDKEWATGQEPVSSFQPDKLDCGQWADAAKSAGMRYAILTTQHVGGFSLWDTAASDYDVASSPYGKDVVRQFVDAFRKRGLKIGLYLCVWDGHHNIVKDNVTEADIDHIKTQLRELLTNYGPIAAIWLDGYQHEKRGRTYFPTTTEVPFQELYALIKGLQPNCLVLRHPGMAMYDLDYSDVQVWEGIFSHEPSYELWRRFQREYPDRAEEICEVNRPAWFWKTGLDRREPRSVDYVIDKLRIAGENDANYLLNAAPNRDGLLDEIVAQRFREVGQALREQDLLKE